MKKHLSKVQQHLLLHLRAKALVGGEAGFWSVLFWLGETRACFCSNLPHTPDPPECHPFIPSTASTIMLYKCQPRKLWLLHLLTPNHRHTLSVGGTEALQYRLSASKNLVSSELVDSFKKNDSTVNSPFSHQGYKEEITELNLSHLKQSYHTD